jgi:hypothetical protein
MESRRFPVRELDRRQGDGLDVTLLWEATTDHLFVVVADMTSGERFRIRVPAANALDAFNHPFAYHRGGGRRDATTQAA